MGKGGERQKKAEVIVSARSDQVTDRSTAFATALQQATKSFKLTERAKAEIVQSQLVQFSEILKIKLRNRLTQYKFQARRLWESIEASGGKFFIPDSVNSVKWDFDESQFKDISMHHVPVTPMSSGTTAMNGLGQAASAMSLLMPHSISGKMGILLVSVLTVGSLYRKLIQDFRPILYLFVAGNAYKTAQLKFQARELSCLLNLVLAFEENGEDELESERIVREVAEQIAVRHINHVSKLSKNGQRTLATVIVERITRHLSRHRYGFHGESAIWYVSELQQFRWNLDAFLKRILLPADRVSSRPKLTLMERCIRALSAESSESDDRVLEIEPLHQDPSSTDGESVWTASGVLSRSGVMVLDQGKLYVHSRTDTECFGFVYGSSNEVQWRRMHPAADVQTEVPQQQHNHQTTSFVAEEDNPSRGQRSKL